VFEKYVHTEEDLEAVEGALSHLDNPKLDFIFEDRKLIQNTLVISFDSNKLFIWTKIKNSKLSKLPSKLEGWNAYQISHDVMIKDKDQRGWHSNLDNKFWKILPDEFKKPWHEIPKISGGLLTPFLGIQKEIEKFGNRPRNPYTTKESYLATIIHEFGHVYFNLINPRYYSDVNETIKYMKSALNAYKSDKKDKKTNNLRFFSSNYLSELFAFCTDYSASMFFWPDHVRDINRYHKWRIEMEIPREKKRNLDSEDTFLADTHKFSSVFGKIIINNYPENWPQIILKAGRTASL